MSDGEDVLIILPVRNAVLFPGVVLPVAIAGKAALAAAQEAVRTQRRVGLLLQTDSSVEEPSPEVAASRRHLPPRSCVSSPRRTARII